jgi:hypothetical protein
MLRQAKSHDLPTGRSDPTLQGPLGRQQATARAESRVPVVATLVGLAAVAAALHTFLVGRVQGPFVFMDELGYQRMALSFAHTGHFSLFGKGGLAYSPLYPILLSPIYALASSLHSAYEWAKVENTVLISLSVFPVYGIARSVLSRDRSIGVAALSLFAPLMLYTGFQLTESLAYPLFLVAIWTMLRTVRRPSVANDALLLAALILASSARLQLVGLIPTAVTAVLLAAAARPEPGDGRAMWRSITAHWLLFGVVCLALVAGLARTATNGGNLPLAGRYANVGHSHASALRVFELFFQHIAGLDWAVGVIPFAAALLAGWALVRLGFPRKALVFASVALASTFWVLLEVAFDAAAFDATKNLPHVRSGFVDLPTFHERYLIYLVPLFLVALFAALDLRSPSRPLIVSAAVAALLPALIPFGTVVNGLNAVHSFSFLMFGRTVSGRTIAVQHATTLAIALSTLLAVVFVLAASRRLPPMAAVLVTGLVFLGLSTLEVGRQLTAIPQKELGVPAQPNWVDRVVGDNTNVSLVGGPGVTMAALRETAFWNSSVARVYYTCLPNFGGDFGEQHLAAGNAARARYAVVPAAMGIRGHVLARDPFGHLVLVAPTGGNVRVPSALRCGR